MQWISARHVHAIVCMRALSRYWINPRITSAYSVLFIKNLLLKISEQKVLKISPVLQSQFTIQFDVSTKKGRAYI